VAFKKQAPVFILKGIFFENLKKKIQPDPLNLKVSAGEIIFHDWKNTVV